MAQLTVSEAAVFCCSETAASCSACSWRRRSECSVSCSWYFARLSDASFASSSALLRQKFSSASSLDVAAVFCRWHKNTMFWQPFFRKTLVSWLCLDFRWVIPQLCLISGEAKTFHIVIDTLLVQWYTEKQIKLHIQWTIPKQIIQQQTYDIIANCDMLSF